MENVTAMAYTTLCPRCGRSIKANFLYCKKCSRQLGQPLGKLEKEPGMHLAYTVVLVLANLGILAYLVWSSYLR